MMGITLRYPMRCATRTNTSRTLRTRRSLRICSISPSIEPQKFEDQYEDALKDLIRKKQKGEKIERPKEPQRSNVVDLMDALKKSVAADKGARPQAKKGKKRLEGQREMLLPIAGKKGKEAAKPVARPATRQKRAG
jgi:DNA end-binding protein Ku